MTESVRRAAKPKARENPTQVLARGAVPSVNDRQDAPTIYADAVQGAMVSANTMKITFIEHFLVEGENVVQGRYVLNLAMPTPQMKAMGELFLRLAGETESAARGK